MTDTQYFILDDLSKNQKEAYMAGAMRDGSISKTTAIQISQKYREWLLYLIKPYFEDVFDIILLESQIKMRNDDGNTRYRLEFSNRAVRDRIHTYFEMPTNQLTWETPSFVKDLQKHDLRYYIQGFWDAEGGATTNATTKSKLYIDFTQRNTESLEFIKEKLLLFGVKAGNIRVSCKKSMSHRITITGRRSILNFVNNIETQHPEKQQRFIRIRNVIQTYYN